jgi:hypothetical protein
MSSVSERKDLDRRGFLRKIASLATSAGIVGLLLDRLSDKSIPQPVQAAGGTSGTALIIDASGPGGQSNTGTGTTQLNSSGSPALIAANTGSGAALEGSCTAGTGVLGTTTIGTGVQGTASGATGAAVGGFAGDPGAIPIVAQGASGQTANLQEWRGSSGALSAVDANGNLGVGLASPARSVHLQGSNAVFRIDRDVNSSAFILVRTALGDFSTIWKTFYVGVDASGVNNGSFFIGDVGTGVSGASNIRLFIDNTGKIGIGTSTPTNMLHVNGGSSTAVRIDGATATTASAGAASLPSRPVGFLVVNIGGTDRKIPYYA